MPYAASRGGIGKAAEGNLQASPRPQPHSNIPTPPMYPLPTGPLTSTAAFPPHAPSGQQQGGSKQETTARDSLLSGAPQPTGTVPQAFVNPSAGPIAPRILPQRTTLPSNPALGAQGNVSMGSQPLGTGNMAAPATYVAASDTANVAALPARASAAAATAAPMAGAIAGAAVGGKDTYAEPINLIDDMEED